MKPQFKRILTALLAAFMILPTVACASGSDPEDTKDRPDTQAATEEDTGYKPDIEKQNYDCDFVITGVDDIRNWAISEEDKVGDPLESAIYERGIRVYDHLGVTLVEKDAGDWVSYSNTILRTVQAGDDEYQLVAAHSFQGVPDLMASGAMYDFSEFDAVDFDAPYWSYGYMESLTIQDRFLIGYNDFCLANSYCMVLNKDLMEKYNLTAPYEWVRNNQWTLDKLISYVSVVSEDNGDGVWDAGDTYGITGWGWTDLVAFLQSSGMKSIDQDDTGLYRVTYEENGEKLLNILDKISRMYDAEYAYFWTPGSERDGTSVGFGSGRTLLQLTNTSSLVGMRGESIRFGVLPYPMYDEEQGKYMSLSVNGNLMVPSTIKNPDMVGETIELLAYYTAPVKTAYFEDLLGSKLAEAPEDAEMLDIIWLSQVSDVGLITSNLAGDAVGNLLYIIPNLCRDGVGTYSSYLAKRLKLANRGLKDLFDPKKKN